MVNTKNNKLKEPKDLALDAVQKMIDSTKYSISYHEEQLDKEKATLEGLLHLLPNTNLK